MRLSDGLPDLRPVGFLHTRARINDAFLRGGREPSRAMVLTKMFSWLRSSAPHDGEKGRRAVLVQRVLKAMLALVFLSAFSALLESGNSVQFTLFFYGGVLVWLLFVELLLLRGHPRSAAWLLCGFFWLLIAFVTLFFGGMRGQYASVFTVCVLLIGGVVGGRQATALALISSAWCGMVVYLEKQGLLPPALGAYSPINAWGAVTVTLLLTSVLLRASLDSLQQMHSRAELAALERDEALRRSIRSQKMELVGNLTSGIAHDFNNLLTVISSASHTLRDELPRLDSESRAWLDDLDGATFRATLMTRQLLALGRAPAGERTAVDLGLLVRELGRMLPRLLGSAIDINVAVQEGAIVLASRAGLEQVLLNLAVNARDAMPEGGTLRLEVRVQDDDVVLEASDTGQGMDEATQARIFEPFFSTKTTGTGLGLATVRQLIASFGGTVRMVSHLGHGSAFEIRLPRTNQPLELELDLPSETQNGPPSIRRRLLLVEDDPLVRRGLCRWLGFEGFEVVPVADGEEALALVGSMRGLACVVSDLSMPRLDGEKLASELAERHPQLPLVLMSGNRRPALELLTRRRAFVEKPVDQARLLAAIDEVMRG